MARSLGTLTIDLIAKTGGFVSGMSKAEREAQMRSKNIQKSIKKIGPVFASVAAAVATATAVVVNELKNTSVEIDRFSRLSNSGTEEFQKLAFAADEYKISNEQLSDILKDVNDKIGDFLQTGGGPLADFFENIAPKVGVTAEQFAKLSGPKALQLYVSSLEKANLTQAEMTFYMEAIASDATLLLPLLSEQGKRYRELADQAERYGVIISDDVIKNSILLERQMKILDAQFTGFKTKLGSEVLPTVTTLTEWMIHLGESGGLVDGIIDRLGDVFDVVAISAIALTSTLENVGRALVGIYDAAGLALSGEFEEASKTIDEFTTKNEESVKKAEELISNIWNGVKPDTSEITTATDEIGERLKKVFGDIGNSSSDTGDKIKSTIDSLNEMVATLGMTGSEVELYKLRMLGASEAQIMFAEDALALRDAFEKQKGEIKSQVKEQAEINNLYEKHQQLIYGVSDSVYAYSITMGELNKLLMAGKINQDEFALASERAEEKIKGSTDIIADFGEEAAKNIQSGLADFLFNPFESGLDGMVSSFADAMQRMVAEAAAAEIMSSIFGSVGGGTGGGFIETAGNWIGSFFGGGRANGGPVMANGIYEFGEFDEPETMRIGNKNYVLPGNNGTITPMAGGRNGVNQFFNITTPNPDSFRASERQIRKRFRQGLA